MPSTQYHDHYEPYDLSSQANGSNVTFVMDIDVTPNASTLRLYVNGVEQLLGTDFTVAGKIITIIGEDIPLKNDSVWAHYLVDVTP